MTGIGPVQEPTILSALEEFQERLEAPGAVKLVGENEAEHEGVGITSIAAHTG